MNQKKKNLALQRRVWCLKKRLLKNKKSNPENPKDIVEKSLKGKFISEKLKNKLIFAETLQDQLKSSLENLGSTKAKKAFYAVFKGDVLRKQRLLKQCQGYLSLKKIRASVKKPHFQKIRWSEKPNIAT